jgi:hypothetical protein
MKILVTHFAPDLDAVGGIWLVKKFLTGWDKAVIKFVPAGLTFGSQPVDTDNNILHIDTGFGRFDHHQIDDSYCSAQKILDYLKEENLKIKKDEALERLVDVVSDIDHFQEVYFPNPNADFYDLGLLSALDGWKLLYPNDHQKLVDLGMACFEGIYKQFQNKVWAEKILKEEAIEFSSPWGKAIGAETTNDEIIHTGQKLGYIIVVRKDPKKGYIRIKSLPDPKIDLSSILTKLKKADPSASWFLHVDKHQLLNGSTKNPEMRPTRLSLKEITKIIQGKEVEKNRI